MGQGAPALRAAISCYYSGNFTRGETADANGTSYVQRVVANAQTAEDSTNVVPAIPVVMNSQSDRPARAAAPDAKTSSARRSGPKQRQDAPHPSWDAFGDSACENDCN
jgi:type IV secretion system protein VirB1